MMQHAQKSLVFLVVFLAMVIAVGMGGLALQRYLNEHADRSAKQFCEREQNFGHYSECLNHLGNPGSGSAD